MAGRNRRDRRPVLEAFEPRTLLSRAHFAPAVHGQKFYQPPVNGTIALNQLLTPSGVPSRAEAAREAYRATFFGEYVLGPGRFSAEASDFYFRGAGSTTQVLHADTQLRVIRPVDPTVNPGGAITIFDRNLDSNTQLGFDVVAAPQSYDRFGRPTQLTIYALDVNISSGSYVEGMAQGTMTIRYGPLPRIPHVRAPRGRIPGVLGQGSAVVSISAQVYSIGTTFNLRNVDINP